MSLLELAILVQICFDFSNIIIQTKDYVDINCVSFLGVAMSGRICVSLLEVAIPGANYASILEIAFNRIKNLVIAIFFHF